MAKGPLITDSVRRIIVKVYFKHPDWRAKEIQRKVNDTLREHNPRINRDWPGLSTVQKVLAAIHKNEKGMPPDPEDSPWHVTSLIKYDLHPEALPTVLEVWLFRLEKKYRPLTIREAKWVARLYRVVSDIRLLDISATQYALDEKVFKISNLFEKVHKSPRDLYRFHNLNIIDDAQLYLYMTGKFVEFDIIGPDHPDYAKKTAVEGGINPEFIVEFKALHETPLSKEFKKRINKGGTK